MAGRGEHPSAVPEGNPRLQAPGVSLLDTMGAALQDGGVPQDVYGSPAGVPVLGVAGPV